MGNTLQRFSRKLASFLIAAIAVFLLYKMSISSRLTPFEPGVALDLEAPEAQKIPLLSLTRLLGLPLATDTAQTDLSIDSPEQGSWSFDTTRDGKAYSLPTKQCDNAFPGLFAEIERAVQYQKKTGLITSDDIDISWKREGAVRAMILDQQELYVIEAKISASSHDSMRALAILHAIYRAIITTPELVPNVEFSFSTSDRADPAHLRHSIWALTRTADEEEKWLMSDFGFWSWPLKVVGEYVQVRQEIASTEVDFFSKKKMVVWRGAASTNIHRKALLVVTAGKGWADVQNIEWADATRIKDQDARKALTLPEHCQYQMVLQTEGRSYSGRGKYLQNCNSVVIMPKRTWIEPHHSLLVSAGPQQNFVEVEEDFSDLEDKVLSLLDNQTKAYQIAQNGIAVFRDRYLTPAAQACYWRKMLRGWAEVSSPPDKRDARSRSAIPFETFAIQAIASNNAGCSRLASYFNLCK